eukprot:1161192-Pelagomonas_calceolata.AAC.7
MQKSRDSAGYKRPNTCQDANGNEKIMPAKKAACIQGSYIRVDPQERRARSLKHTVSRAGVQHDGGRCLAQQRGTTILTHRHCLGVADVAAQTLPLPCFQAPLPPVLKKGCWGIFQT